MIISPERERRTGLDRAEAEDALLFLKVTIGVPSRPREASALLNLLYPAQRMNLGYQRPRKVDSRLDNHTDLNLVQNHAAVQAAMADVINLVIGILIQNLKHGAAW